MFNKLMRVSKITDDGTVPFAPATLYKWNHLNKFPGLFVKIGGALFLDLEELAKIVEANRSR